MMHMHTYKHKHTYISIHMHTYTLTLYKDMAGIRYILVKTEKTAGDRTVISKLW